MAYIENTNDHLKKTNECIENTNVGYPVPIMIFIF